MFDQQLRVPGPTPLPESVIRASAKPMINHRGPEFAALLQQVTSGIQTVLRTTNDVLLYPSSGSGALEATVVNMLSPGEHALVCTMGSFGQRWFDMAVAYGVEATRLDVKPGQPVPPQEVERILSENGKISTVFITHNETSTGVTNDVPAIASIVKQHGKFLCLDTVSGAPCLPLEVDDLDIDVVACGSQKGWMAPPGLAMLSVGKAALRKSEQGKLPRWYFDFPREKKMQDQNQTATTPPVSVMFAIEEGLRLILQEGVEGGWERHRRVGAMIRSGIQSMGLTLLADEAHQSNTVTAVMNPAATADELKALLDHLRTEYGLVIAGGQGDLRGRIFRIGHLGYVDESDVYGILTSLERGLFDFGLLERTGRSVAAASRALEDSTRLQSVPV